MTKNKRKQSGAAVKRGSRKVKRALDADALATWLERSGLSLFDEASFAEWWERSKVTLADMEDMKVSAADLMGDKT
jgi:hypothetical protein